MSFNAARVDDSLFAVSIVCSSADAGLTRNNEPKMSDIATSATFPIMNEAQLVVPSCNKERKKNNKERKKNNKEEACSLPRLQSF